MEKDFVCIEYFDDGVDEGLDGEWHSYSAPTYYLSCGHTAYCFKPRFCPECGKTVMECDDCEMEWPDCE